MLKVGGVMQPGVAPRFSQNPDATPGRPPSPGADTRSVLKEAGLDADGLLASGVAAGERP